MEAAVAYARHRRDRKARTRPHSSSGAAESNSDESDDVEDELPDPDPAETAATAGSEKTAEAAAACEKRRQAACNIGLEPLLSTPGASGVLRVSVDAEAASACGSFLLENWADGKLLLPSCHDNRALDPSTADHDAKADHEALPRVISGWTTYGKTLSAHDANQQRCTTLLFTNALLPACRRHLPGFASMEDSLVGWLHATFGIVVELFYAHGLRQGPQTLRSTGFDVHQECEQIVSRLSDVYAQ